MKLDLNFDDISTIEFGVEWGDSDKQSFTLVPTDGVVQRALADMARATRDAMQELTDNPPTYEPSEKYTGTEYVYLPLNDELAGRIRNLHQANNLTMDANALKEPGKVSCYFARITDRRGGRLTGLRRASQFKGLLKKRLISFVSDALKLIEDRVFKMDEDFDLLVDAEKVHILRPSGFEFVGKLKEAVLAAVPQNIKAVQRDLGFVDFANVQAYASRHARAARYLASIRSQKETKGIDRAALKKLCKNTGVDVQDAGGKLTLPDSEIMGFLEVLDRRRYELELVKASPERFRASSRRKIEA